MSQTSSSNHSTLSTEQATLSLLDVASEMKELYKGSSANDALYLTNTALLTEDTDTKNVYIDDEEEYSATLPVANPYERLGTERVDKLQSSQMSSRLQMHNFAHSSITCTCVFTTTVWSKLMSLTCR